MTTLYVDNIAPNLQTKISAPNLQLPSGSVIQVVQHADTSNYTTSSLAYVQGPQTGTINLSSSSSKALVTINCCMRAARSSVVVGARLQIFRGSVSSGTRLHTGTEPQFYAQDSGNELYNLVTIQYLDAPGATSVSYSMGFNKHPSSGDAHIYGSFMTSTIIVQEIAG